MDLIDRAALLKIFEDVQKTDPMIDSGRGYADNFINDGGEPSTEWFAVEDLVYKMPTIEAVPLIALCEWLEKNATMDCDGCRATIGSCEDDDVNEKVCNSRERWKKMLTKWMEGLDAAESMVQKT